MTNMKLGEQVAYPSRYDASLLEAIPRSLSREALEPAALRFFGVDLWTAYEVSWLNEKGLPQIALMEFEIDAASENLVESKSLKYYLNSFNQTRFANESEVVVRIQKDLAPLVNGSLKVHIVNGFDVEQAPGYCIDGLDCEIETYQPNSKLLALKAGATQVNKRQLYSNLLKSNCPVTGQPDWASVWVEYSGKEIDEQSLLRYIVSYRDHQGFHENCVEQIYTDIANELKPEYLCVYARYTRRGGLDINPLRSSVKDFKVPFRRLLRQ